MSITDELREWMDRTTIRFDDRGCLLGTAEELTAIADRIDAEHERAIDAMWEDAKSHMTDESMAEHGWVRLPKDADGEYIHVGDMMERGKARGHVIALMLSNYPKKWGGGLHWGVQLEGEYAPTALDLTFHHYHKPTVEDVLRQVIACANNGTHVHGALDTEQIVAEYAAKLRLAEGEDA